MVATSPSSTGCSPSFTGTFANSSAGLAPTITLCVTRYCRSPTFSAPDGATALPAFTASATCQSVMPCLVTASGFTFTTMVRWLPPNGGGADTPGSAANIGRTLNSAWSCTSATLLVWLVSTRNPTGTLPVSKRVTNGGTVPGGMNARDRLTAATVSDIACDMSVPGWKYNLICTMPCTLRLST